MTDEMKAKTQSCCFPASKNGYDRVDQQTLDADGAPIAGTTRAFWTTARPSGSARPSTSWRWRRRAGFIAL